MDAQSTIPNLNAKMHVSNNEVHMKSNNISDSLKVNTSMSVGTIMMKQQIFDYNYESLENLPSIKGTTLVGDKDFEDFGLVKISDQRIDNLIYG